MGVEQETAIGWGILLNGEEIQMLDKAAEKEVGEKNYGGLYEYAPDGIYVVMDMVMDGSFIFVGDIITEDEESYKRNKFCLIKDEMPMELFQDFIKKMDNLTHNRFEFSKRKIDFRVYTYLIHLT